MNVFLSPVDGQGQCTLRLHQPARIMPGSQVNNYEFIFIVIDLDGPALSREHHSEPICIVIHMIHMTLQGTTLHCPKYVGEGEALDAVTWILEVLEVDSSIIVV